jgi:hypothetical protein
MRDYLSCADTAKLVRQALKAAFPGQTFSVRSSTYSGGASIRVGWVDGPQTNQVDQVAKVFAGSSFDGMIDLKTSNQHWLYPDGHVELFQYEIGHSYGSSTLDLLGERVTPEQARAYSAGVHAAYGERTTWQETGDPADETAWKAGLTEGQTRKTQGARLVHFGADYVFTERELSTATRERLQAAVAFLGGMTAGGDLVGQFDPNRRYSFHIEGHRWFDEYGSTLVHQLSAQVSEDELAEAINAERARRGRPRELPAEEDGRRLYVVTEGGQQRLEWRDA